MNSHGKLNVEHIAKNLNSRRTDCCLTYQYGFYTGIGVHLELYIVNPDYKYKFCVWSGYKHFYIKKINNTGTVNLMFIQCST